MSEEKREKDCSGYCAACGFEHSIPQGNARKQAQKLRDRLEQEKTIDIFSPNRGQNPLLSTDSLFGEDRGKMFGVLECMNRHRQIIWLYAFSGQFGSSWSVTGWAPPLFDTQRFRSLNDPAEQQIKAIGKEIEVAAPDPNRARELKKKRRERSRLLMRKIHDLYRVHNFHGGVAQLDKAFLYPGGKPTGTGDCCAPKLLNTAAVSDLVPLSLAEFFFGRSNRSGSREHARFYAPCSDKCRPLLGFMLCGAEQRKNSFYDRS